MVRLFLQRLYEENKNDAPMWNRTCLIWGVFAESARRVPRSGKRAGSGQIRRPKFDLAPGGGDC